MNRLEALKRSHERRDEEVYVETLIGSRADGSHSQPLSLCAGLLVHEDY